MNTNHAKTWRQQQATERVAVERKVIRVRKQSWITKGEKFLYTVIGTLILCFGFYMVAYAAKTDQLNRSLQSLETKVQHQKIENEGLVFEIKELSKPERITKIAKDNGLKIKEAEVKQAKALNN